MSKQMPTTNDVSLSLEHIMTLEQVKSAKYLGITITDNIDWGQHISEISSMWDILKTKAMMMRRNSDDILSERPLDSPLNRVEWNWVV